MKRRCELCRSCIAWSTTIVLVWLSLSGCSGIGLRFDSNLQQISAHQRYRVNFAKLLKPVDSGAILQVAQESGYWIRIGHEPEVIYYQGNNICRTCNYQRESEFFRGSRLYLDPVGSTYAVYVQTEEAEIVLMNNSGILEVFFAPYTDMISQNAAELVVDALEHFGQQDAYAGLKMTFQELPKEQQLR